MFPAMNAQVVTKRFTAGTGATTLGSIACGVMSTGPQVLLSVPAVVDVSGMEFSFNVYADGISGKPTLEASTGSVVSVTLSDGGATGDATTVAVLATATTNTVAWSDTVPRDVSGSSATDLDADDWVNFHITANVATVAGIGQMDVALAYIYGKPGAIA